MKEILLLEHIWGTLIGITLLFFFISRQRQAEGEIEFLTTGRYTYNPTPISKKQVNNLFLISLVAPSIFLLLTNIIKWNIILLFIALISAFLMPHVKLATRFFAENIERSNIKNFNHEYLKFAFLITIVAGPATGYVARKFEVTAVEDAILITFIMSIYFLFYSWIIFSVYKRSKKRYIETLISHGKFKYGKKLSKFWIILFLSVFSIHAFNVIYQFQSKYTVGLYFFISGSIIYEFLKRFKEVPPISVKSNTLMFVILFLLVFVEEFLTLFVQYFEIDITFWVYLLSIFLGAVFLNYQFTLIDYANMRKDIYYLWYDLTIKSYGAIQVLLLVWIFGTFLVLISQEVMTLHSVFLPFIIIVLFFRLFIQSRKQLKIFLKNHLEDALTDDLISKQRLKKRYKELGRPLPKWLRKK